MIKKALKDMCQHSVLSHIVEEQLITHRNHCSYIDAVTHGYSHYLANTEACCLPWRLYG